MLGKFARVGIGKCAGCSGVGAAGICMDGAAAAGPTDGTAVTAVLAVDVLPLLFAGAKNMLGAELTGTGTTFTAVADCACCCILVAADNGACCACDM